MGALKAVQGQGGVTLEDALPLNALVFDEGTKLALANVMARMSDPHRTERLGGTLPTGIMFFGPPGTGKTAACKAMAKELGWNLLYATGADLSRDPKALDRLHAKAKELRPAIVFIDEADDLMQCREFARSTEAANKLLTLMDGVSQRIADIVWVAATNHLEAVDVAFLRGGRLAEKIEFRLPEPALLAEHIVRWLQARRIDLAPDFRMEDVPGILGDISIADAEAVLQAAVNLAIGRREGAARVCRQDLDRARQLIGY
jgi:transitional endoplasmic reticulum ATPase